MVDGVNELQGFVDGHGHYVGQVISHDEATAYPFVETSAVTFGAFFGTGHAVENFLLAFALLGSDDAAIHAGVKAFEFG